MRFLTSEEKAVIIRNYREYFGIHTFIETGTHIGTTVYELLRDFQALFTIELGEALWRTAKERFVGYPHVCCLLGDSGVILPELLLGQHLPALFWLDGHYSGGGTARGATDTPIVKELEAAVTAPQGSVILIDDARLFGGMEEHTEEFADYPDISWIEETALAHGFAYSLEADIIRLTPWS